MEIETTAEWDAICRICLQEGQLHSILDFDDEKSDLNIAEKIMLCSSITVSWNAANKKLPSMSQEDFHFINFILIFIIRSQQMVDCRSKFVLIVCMIWT